MKLSFTVLDETFETEDCDLENELIQGSALTLGQSLGIAPKSIWYLLHMGWTQSIQDSYAGPRAKAKREGEDYEAAMLASASKRMNAIKDGLMSIDASGGRDPIRSVGLQMLEAHVASKGRAMPSKKEAKEAMLNKWIATRKDEIEAEIRRRRSFKAQSSEATLDDI